MGILNEEAVLETIGICRGNLSAIARRALRGVAQGAPDQSGFLPKDTVLIGCQQLLTVVNSC